MAGVSMEKRRSDRELDIYQGGGVIAWIEDF